VRLKQYEALSSNPSPTLKKKAGEEDLGHDSRGNPSILKTKGKDRILFPG
jgi:hypothetical protein